MTDHRAVLSIDVELFDQTPAYRNASGSTGESGVGLDGLSFLRDALAEHDARSTGFVVAELAETYPDAIQAFADDGHEIGSHTHSHRLLSDLDPATQREEIERSRAVLAETTGAKVRGFRAPAFDLAENHFQVLATAGYTYDSSVVSSRAIPGWYGGEYDVHRPTPAAEIDTDAPGSIRELPVSVMPRLRLPLTGTWLRFFGPRYTILGMRWLARRGITPVLYVHPWECVDLPDVEGVPSRVYYHTGAWMRRAIERILSSEFTFVSAGEVVAGGDSGSPETGTIDGGD
ncbi:chitin deacetylase protein [Halorhabdus tiamatea SARL4B]|uniref:Chitin deacetylase protein n=1 Tax=Halorhabdus tiamatea SARL4B TaxID=1033806 RepID=F7PQ01_9EURY|nr:polysaccharide deacetylase family protein [Halorhabdus tiamatea]ERJ07346.1 chitin deacetylase protein [Halorhabdus tiamatea SARL4B]CCQ34123.1 polysaccharide deacetylase [Halorhabdus tiamatea SARL4B]